MVWTIVLKEFPSFSSLDLCLMLHPAYLAQAPTPPLVLCGY